MRRVMWLLGAAAMAALAVPAPVTHAPAAVPSWQQQLTDGGAELPFVPELAAVSCPSERGPVKEGSDADRDKVSTTLVSASITQLRARPKPSTYPRNNRVTASEVHVWSLTGYITQYREESDGDIHLVVKDSVGHSIIAEMPYSACVPSASRWRTQINATRTAFARTYPVSTSWHYVRRLADLHGVGFMDPPHGQTGAAPNGFELHPVIYIRLR